MTTRIMTVQLQDDKLGTYDTTELHIQYCEQCKRDTYHVEDECVHVFRGKK